MILPLLWVLLAALALALAWTTRSVAFAWVGYLMVVTWLVGLLASRAAHRGVSADRQLSSDRVPFGGDARVEVKVVNRSRIPVLWLAAAESLPAGLPMTGVRGRVGPLAGRGEFSFQYSLHGARRGYHQVGPTVLRTGDLFGIVQRDRVAGAPARLTVYPRVVAITRARAPSRHPVGELRARQRVIEDPTQVVGVRPYQDGDGIRRVHWRATAHTGRLQSKLFEITAQLDILLVLNLRRSDYPDSPVDAEERAELAIVAAASVAHHLLDRHQRVGLLVLGADPAAQQAKGPARVRAGRGRDQLAAVMSALGRAELGPAAELSEILAGEKEGLALGSLVLVVTPRVAEGALSSIIALRSAGLEVGVTLVGRAADLRASVAALETLGITAARVSSEADIRDLPL